MIKHIFNRIKSYRLRKKKVSLMRLNAPNCFFADLSCYDIDSIYEGWNNINKGVIFNGKIGYGSYIGSDTKLPKTSIGRYCSISWNVQLISGTHPSRKYVSTHPAFFSITKQAGFTYVKEQLVDECKYADEQSEYLVVIGNDVWIGANVLIMEGITIGDGAIIGAGSVVTKDVLPYAIVGGVPAKVIRFRFADDEIAFLKDYQWWNKDKDWIESHVEYFSDIKLFQENCKKVSFKDLDK